MVRRRVTFRELTSPSGAMPANGGCYSDQICRTIEFACKLRITDFSNQPNTVWHTYLDASRKLNMYIFATSNMYILYYIHKHTCNWIDDYTTLNKLI